MIARRPKVLRQRTKASELVVVAEAASHKVEIRTCKIGPWQLPRSKGKRERPELLCC